MVGSDTGYSLVSYLSLLDLHSCKIRTLNTVTLNTHMEKIYSCMT